MLLRKAILKVTMFAKIAGARQSDHGGRAGFVKSMPERAVMPSDLRIQGVRPKKSRFDDVGKSKASVVPLIDRKPDCDFQPERKRGIKYANRAIHLTPTSWHSGC